ncbi:MAG: hypothetical protein KC912_17010 [Proteobacteria bacterium]|nr:hypothetical protein [Pseudomonadota bacterium]
MTAKPGFVALCLFLSTACRPSFDTLEEACMSRTPGEAGVDDGSTATAVVAEVNCYRRFAGMFRTRVSGQLSDSASAHARYLDLNGWEATGNGLFEDPAYDGFTGVDPIERGIEFGYDWGLRDIAFWEGSTQEADLSPAEYVASFMHEPYSRQAVLQPGLRAVGYGTEGEWAVSDWHYDWPTSAHTERPVLWPVDGAVDIPTHAPFLNEDFSTSFRGYVATATVGSSTGQLGSADPYGMVIRDWRLTGPDGEVATFTIRPTTQTAALPYSVGIVPEQPLEPLTTYTVWIDLSWDDEEKEVTWSFTTGEEGFEP